MMAKTRIKRSQQSDLHKVSLRHTENEGILHRIVFRGKIFGQDFQKTLMECLVGRTTTQALINIAVEHAVLALPYGLIRMRWQSVSQARRTHLDHLRHLIWRGPKSSLSRIEDMSTAQG